MKKIICLALAFFAVSCSKPQVSVSDINNESKGEVVSYKNGEFIQPSTKKELSNKKNEYDIGIIQYAGTENFESIRKSFEDKMTEQGFKVGENTVIEVEYAYGNEERAEIIAKKYSAQNKDLILTVSPTALKYAQKATRKVPVVFTAVTDPKAYISDTEKPSGNITGIADFVPVEKQIEFIKKIKPSVKSVCIIYAKEYQYSEFQAKRAEEEAKALGIETSLCAVVDKADVNALTSDYKKKYDAIYIPSDALLNDEQTLNTISENCKCLIMAGDKEMVKNGADATVIQDYSQVGSLAAQMSSAILLGAKISEIPVMQVDKYIYCTNKETAASLPKDITAETVE